ncbi:hypothetical protein QYM36_008953 [Artemia franciscana]|uniref:Uncharacterized protein n=1 Tax=Artemia franciscana TaxID=6661 RepID=A0AA88L6D3_ARTSF|nr:hypothetical protein QYM36_008953 [Artemia franciscana]
MSLENPLNETPERVFDRFKTTAWEIFRPRYPTMTEDDLNTFIEWQWDRFKKDPTMMEHPELLGKMKREFDRMS